MHQEAANQAQDIHLHETVFPGTLSSVVGIEIAFEAAAGSGWEKMAGKRDRRGGREVLLGEGNDLGGRVMEGWCMRWVPSMDRLGG